MVLRFHRLVLTIHAVVNVFVSLAVVVSWLIGPENVSPLAMLLFSCYCSFGMSVSVFRTITSLCEGTYLSDKCQAPTRETYRVASKGLTVQKW